MFFHFKEINPSNMQKIPASISDWATVQPGNGAGCPNTEDHYPEGKPKHTLLQNSILVCRTASFCKGIQGRGMETSPSASLRGKNRREKFPLNYQAALTWCTH